MSAECFICGGLHDEADCPRQTVITVVESAQLASQPPIDVPSITLADGFERGVQAERARIVAWLRAAPLTGPAETAYADAIERGEHTKEPT